MTWAATTLARERSSAAVRGTRSLVMMRGPEGEGEALSKPVGLDEALVTAIAQRSGTVCTSRIAEPRLALDAWDNVLRAETVRITSWLVTRTDPELALEYVRAAPPGQAPYSFVSIDADRWSAHLWHTPLVDVVMRRCGIAGSVGPVEPVRMSVSPDTGAARPADKADLLRALRETKTYKSVDGFGQAMIDLLASEGARVAYSYERRMALVPLPGGREAVRVDCPKKGGLDIAFQTRKGKLPYFDDSVYSMINKNYPDVTKRVSEILGACQAHGIDVFEVSDNAWIDSLI